jgi:hypothetical protein
MKHSNTQSQTKKNTQIIKGVQQYGNMMQENQIKINWVKSARPIASNFRMKAEKLQTQVPTRFVVGRV